ncbi:MAG: phospholipase [Gemmatimonadetes bacterium]|nr:phospholipase [Gemmatimonadota bacterium]MDA1104010.1 phospholipase [Gemmatimonadota bacterium]
MNMDSEETPVLREAESHHLQITKTARYWTLGDATRAEEVWFVLHGYKQLARRFLRRFETIDDGRRLIVAPEALSRFYIGQEAGRHGPTSAVGATWMTREDRHAEIEDYIGYLDRLAERVSGATGKQLPTTVLGFSQGVATATRWVTMGSILPERLILWGDVTPPDLALERAAEALSGIDLVLVRGDQDAALSPRLVEDDRERLHGAGINVRTVNYPGGHDIDEATLASLVRGG